MNGAILEMAWVYGAALLGVPANWVTALVWAVVLTGLALWMMSTIGVAHPAMRAHR
jgi:branched-subunit amino acid ABC-type transport system permease component